jgi:hypothetical protein
MCRTGLFFSLVALIFNFQSRAEAAELVELVTALKSGGYGIVLRHGATDESQKDIFPFRFEDMSAQRQLNDKGRNTARDVGTSLAKLGVPIGDVYTSRLNRAVESGKLIGRKEVSPTDALTDSSFGSASGMANPDGKNAKAGRAVRELIEVPPKAGSNTLAITHKTNITDAFGKEYADIKEGEALIFKPNASSPATFVMRVQADQWVFLARS